MSSDTSLESITVVFESGCTQESEDVAAAGASAYPVFIVDDGGCTPTGRNESIFKPEVVIVTDDESPRFTQP